MPLFNNFPYSNMHELNIDWAIQTLKAIYTQGTTLYNDLGEWKTQTEADISEWEASVEDTFTQIKNDAIQAKNNALAASVDAALSKIAAENAVNRANAILTAINDIVYGLNASKVNRPVVNSQYSDGTRGQFLRTNGDDI